MAIRRSSMAPARYRSGRARQRTTSAAGFNRVHPGVQRWTETGTVMWAGPPSPVLAVLVIVSSPAYQALPSNRSRRRHRCRPRACRPSQDAALRQINCAEACRRGGGQRTAEQRAEEERSRRERDQKAADQSAAENVRKAPRTAEQDARKKKRQSPRRAGADLAAGQPVRFAPRPHEDLGINIAENAGAVNVPVRGSSG